MAPSRNSPESRARTVLWHIETDLSPSPEQTWYFAPSKSAYWPDMMACGVKKREEVLEKGVLDHDGEAAEQLVYQLWYNHQGSQGSQGRYARHGRYSHDGPPGIGEYILRMGGHEANVALDGKRKQRKKMAFWKRAVQEALREDAMIPVS